MGVRRGATVLLAVLLARTNRHRNWPKPPLVFVRDGVTLSVRRDPVRTLTVIVTSSDGEYNQAGVDPHGELAEGIELGTTFGFNWVAPGELAPGQVRPALRVYGCWQVMQAPSDVF